MTKRQEITVILPIKATSSPLQGGLRHETAKAGKDVRKLESLSAVGGNAKMTAPHVIKWRNTAGSSNPLLNVRTKGPEAET